MNYQKIYDNIINRAKNREINLYYEKHHIIPKCLGGTNDDDNIVKLSAREHFICHWLLHRQFPNNKKLGFAFAMMVKTNNSSGRTYKISSRVYEEAKLAFAESMKSLDRSEEWKSNISKGHRGKNLTEEHKLKIGNANRGKTKPPRTKEHLEKISNSLKGIVRGELSKDHRKKISKALKGYSKTKEHLDNISKALSGRKLSKEHLDNISKALSGRKLSKEHKLKIGLGNIGKKLSEETKEKLKKPKPNGFSEKLSEVKRGVKIGPLPRIKCPHCNTEMSINNAKRFHLDNCKYKK